MPAASKATWMAVAVLGLGVARVPGFQCAIWKPALLWRDRPLTCLRAPDRRVAEDRWRLVYRDHDEPLGLCRVNPSAAAKRRQSVVRPAVQGSRLNEAPPRLPLANSSVRLRHPVPREGRDPPRGLASMMPISPPEQEQESQSWGRTVDLRPAIDGVLPHPFHQ
jgi:hypothetical protein